MFGSNSSYPWQKESNCVKPWQEDSSLDKRQGHHGIAQNGASYQGRWCERHHCSILSGSDGTYPCTKAALFWEASQSLAQFASAQRCQAGPLLGEQVGKEEICGGQLAYEEIKHFIWSNQNLAREVCWLLDAWWVWKLWEETQKLRKKICLTLPWKWRKVRMIGSWAIQSALTKGKALSKGQCSRKSL